LVYNKKRTNQENNGILRTKFNKPLVKDDHVHRIRLIEKLNINYQKNALTLVSAPAGYGKSLLVGCWLLNYNIPFAWISLDENDNDLQTFLEYVIASIDNVSKGKLDSSVKLLQSVKTKPLQEISNILINSIDKIDKEFVLVIDDYHNIKNTDIHLLIDNLLQYPPDNIHLCIITRRDPPLKIGSLRAYNRMNEIRMNDLSFTLEEIKILFRNMTDLEIGEALSEKLLKRTEGWVTGLRLTALSVNSVEQLNGILNKIKEDNPVIIDFLVEETLDKMPEEFQKLLLKTSLLEKFCPELVDILETSEGKKKDDNINGNELIKWLESTNLFIIPLDEEHKWFRYNPLFREILSNQLKKKISQEQISTLNKKLSQWFEDKIQIENAIDHAMKAGDEELAADIVERNSAKGMDCDEWLRLEKWLSMLPVDVIDRRPRLLVLMAWIGKISFNFNLLAVSLNKCQVLLGKHPEKSPLYGEICCLLGYLRLFVDTDINEGIKFIKTAMKLVPDNNYGALRAETEMQYVLLKHCSGKNKEAIDYALNRLYKLNPDKQRLWERLQFGLCSVYLLDGDLLHCYRYAKQMLESIEKNRNVFAVVWSRWFMGITSFYKFELEEAKKHFEYVSQNRFNVFNHAVIDSIYSLAVTYQLLGEESKADETVDLMDDYAGWTKRPSHNTLLKSLKARLWLLRGNISEAIIWQRSFNIDVVMPTIGFFVGARTITECAVLIAEATELSLMSAGKKLKNMFDVTKALNYNGKSVELLILQSIMYNKQGLERQSLSAMKRALAIAESQGWILPFIEYGKDTMDILDKFIKKRVYVPYCQKLIEIYKKFQISEKKNALSKQNLVEDLCEPLSQRELEILSLLSLGFKNKEIGDKIYLSPTTIKKHVYNIFQKLNVHTRFDAISKARKLGLISKSI
jgi:LuxR family transcriptional regulator, maltose regulon positive regulatory protein